MAEKAKKTIKTKDVSVVNAKGKTASTRKKATKKTTATVKNKKEVSKESTVSSTAPVQEPVVKEVVKKEQPAKAKSTKKSEPKIDKETKTTTVEATKTPSTAEVKAEVKTEVKEEVKAETKKPAKKTTAKKAPAKKAAAKKETVKKEAVKKEPAKKTAAKKAPAKKTATKKAEKEEALRAEKMKQYQSFSVETCIDMANAMGIQKNYDDYAKLLLEEADESKIAERVIAEANVKASDFNYEKDGYDLELIPVLISRISKTVDLKASDFANMKQMVEEVTKAKLSDDALVNNETYNKLLDVVRKVLMIAQRKNLHTLAEIQEILGISVEELVVSYMDAAYMVLVNWQYGDVKFYEGFIYSVLSQFEELHQSLGNRAMMDVADLYIIHGDYSRGDADYNYIIRENSIKDLIFYRYAHVYENIDRDRARAIAEESRQFVDERFDYYESIKKILEN